MIRIGENGEKKIAPEELDAMAGTVTHRVRCTDIAGWFDEDRFGVILPHTPGSRAWNLATELKKALEGKEDSKQGVECMVYVYPLLDLQKWTVP